MKSKFVLIATLLALYLGTTSVLALDISGNYSGIANGFAINASDGTLIIPPAEANLSVNIEQTGNLLKAEVQEVGMDNQPTGQTYYMVGSIRDNFVILYYAGVEKLMGDSAITEGISMGEVLESGDIVLNTVGGGMDEEGNIIFTWSEVDTLKKA